MCDVMRCDSEKPIKIAYKWSSSSKGNKFTLDETGYVLTRTDTDSSWCLARSDTPLEEGKIYYWEIKLESFSPSSTQNGWDMVVGVVTKVFSTFNSNSVGYGAGAGYGYILRNGNKVTESKWAAYAQPCYTQGDTVGVCVNMIQRTISFSRNGESQGIAFSDIDVSAKLYPAFSSYVPCRVRLVQQ
eukprot:GEZU01020711.1.p1 GENE.GEZU01020711.1~~GEZU01020711.1.p1  ORF type:complete len:186 (-),score=41.61 GEZU01020711.1:76-633(-)